MCLKLSKCQIFASFQNFQQIFIDILQIRLNIFELILIYLQQFLKYLKFILYIKIFLQFACLSRLLLGLP